MTTVEQVREVLSTVTDPEIPVITIEDLGILRDVQVDGGHVTVTITPTYSGCPAMEAIASRIAFEAHQQGYAADVRTQLSPAWTTDWMTDEGRAALQRYGIAPPDLAKTATCPQCGSTDTEQVSRFGSTPCKAQWRCKACLEPFDRFKCH